MRQQGFLSWDQGVRGEPAEVSRHIERQLQGIVDRFRDADIAAKRVKQSLQQSLPLSKAILGRANVEQSPDPATSSNHQPGNAEGRSIALAEQGDSSKLQSYGGYRNDRNQTWDQAGDQIEQSELSC